jgi:kinesin family protein 6/9
MKIEDTDNDSLNQTKNTPSKNSKCHAISELVKNMSMGRQEAFEIFKRDYSGNEEIEDQKRYLKKNYSEAKLLGEQINTTRTKLSRNSFF